MKADIRATYLMTYVSRQFMGPSRPSCG